MREAAKRFRQRDELEKKLRLLDREISEITAAYSRESRVWGYTPLMFRNEIARRGLA